jgi:hypothetical protein
MNGQHNKKEGILFRHLLFLLVPIGVFYCFMSYSYMSFDYFIKIKSI